MSPHQSTPTKRDYCHQRCDWKFQSDANYLLKYFMLTSVHGDKVWRSDGPNRTRVTSLTQNSPESWTFKDYDRPLHGSDYQPFLTFWRFINFVVDEDGSINCCKRNNFNVLYYNGKIFGSAHPVGVPPFITDSMPCRSLAKQIRGGDRTPVVEWPPENPSDWPID